MDIESGLSLLAEAARQNGRGAGGAEVIRNGSHLMFRLPAGIVARIGEAGTEDVAAREIAVSRWLQEHAVPVVRSASGFTQPTTARGHPVTWWDVLPPHRTATPGELGGLLRRLHDLPLPSAIDLPLFSPLSDVRRRVASALLPEDDRAWINERLATLEREFTQLAFTERPKLIHGDAWQGNVAVLETGEPILLDLEAVCLGPTQWDLIAVAVDYTDFARISTNEYHDFVNAYGVDVTEAPGYRTLADIQEFRWASFILSKASQDPAALAEAAHRISCLKGETSRPWKWTAF